mmetsp:Transcript_18995/g.31503  ORF Transcript_18995/g.31503 Transcript_18995/m.31503 type:complete len:201 (+) Transcript_18995:16-618(+)
MITMLTTTSIIFLLSALLLNTEAAAYRWAASIDRSTGIAQSCESSRVPATSRLSQQPSVEDVFSLYPQWLSTFRISMGLLTTKKQADGSTSLQDRLFGLHLLEFGKHKCTDANTVLIPINGGILARSDDGRNYGGLSFSLRQEGEIMETAIYHGYRPTIAGKAPVSCVRAWTYRSTQSLLHAYVMWRFHGYCYDATAPWE